MNEMRRRDIEGNKEERESSINTKGAVNGLAARSKIQ